MKNSFFGLLILIACFACNSKAPVLEIPNSQENDSTKVSEKTALPPHSYGGWYCPDNILGFPAVDIKDLHKVPSVTDRLPTREETMEGKSLIYLDPVQYPNAKPLDMSLPRLARYYSEYTKKNELVVIIQAVEIGQDSIVGFRFLNGGNGSAWLKEVNFVSEKEMEELASTPFVSLGLEINALPKIIWEIMTSPKYAKMIGEMLAENAYYESEWKKDSAVYFKNAPDNILTKGIITALWKNMYIQVDYDFNGDNYVEKFLFLKNNRKRHTEIQMVAGPFGSDYPAQLLAWNNWLGKVKELSEQKMNFGSYFGVVDNSWE